VLSNGKRSSRGREYENVAYHPQFGRMTQRTFNRIYATLPADRPMDPWLMRRTLASITANQPVSAAVQAARNLPRQVAIPRARQQRFVYTKVGDAFVDVRTGEILKAKTVAERELTDPCRQSKDDRRGSLLASGHGGINGVRNYRKHKEC